MTLVQNLVYQFRSAARPSTFWISSSNLDLEIDAPIKKLKVQNGEVFAEVADQLRNAEAFKFLPASPNWSLVREARCAAGARNCSWNVLAGARSIR